MSRIADDNPTAHELSATIISVPTATCTAACGAVTILAGPVTIHGDTYEVADNTEFDVSINPGGVRVLRYWYHDDQAREIVNAIRELLAPGSKPTWQRVTDFLMPGSDVDAMNKRLARIKKRTGLTRADLQKVARQA